MSQEKLFENNSETVSVHENTALKAKVIGIGGAGLSLVDGLRLDNFTGVDQLAIDVDARALGDSIASEKMAIGRTLTRGMGTGGETALARKAIEEEKENIRKSLEGVDLIFLLAGLGGGTGGGATPAIAKLARESGALVFAFVPMPLVGKKVVMLKQRILWQNCASLPMQLFHFPMILFYKWGGQMPPHLNALRRQAEM